MSDVTIKKYTDIPVAEFADGDTVLTVGSDNKLKRVNSTPGGGGGLTRIFIPYYSYDKWEPGEHMLYRSYIKCLYPPFITSEQYQYFDTLEDCVNRVNGHSISDIINSSILDVTQLDQYMVTIVPFEPTNSPATELDLDYEHWSAHYNLLETNEPVFMLPPIISRPLIINSTTETGTPAAPADLAMGWHFETPRSEDIDAELYDTEWVNWMQAFVGES